MTKQTNAKAKRRRHLHQAYKERLEVKEWTPGKRTYDLLKGFLNINPHLVFKTGNGLATMPTARSILARAKCDETIPRDFAISDGGRFLKAFKPGDTLKLYVDRAEVNGTTVYYSEPDQDPYMDIKVLSVNARFSMEKAIYKDICKAAKDLGVEYIMVSGEGKAIVVSAKDPHETSSAKEIRFEDENLDNPKFQAVFELGYFNKLIPANYYVEITEKYNLVGFAHFNDLVGLEYWVALENPPPA